MVNIINLSLCWIIEKKLEAKIANIEFEHETIRFRLNLATTVPTD